jgi:hypothetical protein
MICEIILITAVIVLTIVVLYLYFSRIKEYHSNDIPILKDLKQTLEQIHPAAKSISLYRGEKSYTINKKKVYLCLKDKDGKYYNNNMLMYVALHELSHVICDEIGHTDKFNRIFDDLLQKAQKMGVYNPSLPLDKNYCEY